MKVGEALRVEKDRFFPADMLLLASTNRSGVAYVETMNLDGESNLKLKKALASTQALDNESLANFGVRCTFMMDCERRAKCLWVLGGLKTSCSGRVSGCHAQACMWRPTSLFAATTLEISMLVYFTRPELNLTRTGLQATCTALLLCKGGCMTSTYFLFS